MNSSLSFKRIITVFLMFAALAAMLTACGGSQDTGTSGSQTAEETKAGGTDTYEVAGDYYLDLAELGMKLTIYLRLNDDGTFIFSDTPEFEVDKSSGTYQQSDDGYVMVFTSVNGEEKSISDGLTSSFFMTEDGKLDFTICERIYYGSASATTTSDEYPDAKLMGIIIPDNYEMPSTETEFKTGTYISDDASVRVRFFEDETYVTVSGVVYEGGKFSVSTTQLALEPYGGSRASCEVVSEDELSVSVPSGDDRAVVSLNRSEAAPETVYELTGQGTVTGTSDTFDVALIIYNDATYTINANGFEESGVILLDAANGSFTTYPDNPEDGTKGLAQVTSVPSGKMTTDETGRLMLEEFRVRTSENLSRDKCNLTQA